MKYGTKVKIHNCKYCGGPVYKIWDQRSVYHNDVEDYWNVDTHNIPNDCIRYLASELKRIGS